MIVAIVDNDNNIIDYLFSIMVPLLSGQMVLGRIHVFTALMWYQFVNMYGILEHCGYNFPWYPMSVYPFGVDLDYHDFHHSSNTGNYGTLFSFWDFIFKTSQSYSKMTATKRKNNLEKFK